MAIGQAIYLAESIANYFVKNKQPTEIFNYSVKARILSLGIDDYVGQVNNLILRGNAARMLKEFKRDAYIKSLAPGGIYFSKYLQRRTFLRGIIRYIFSWLLFYEDNP